MLLMSMWSKSVSSPVTVESALEFHPWRVRVGIAVYMLGSFRPPCVLLHRGVTPIGSTYIINEVETYRASFPE